MRRWFWVFGIANLAMLTSVNNFLGTWLGTAPPSTRDGVDSSVFVAALLIVLALRK